ncbi:Helix-turn-helix domain-containing protein [Asanoa hainanensis]|uniref:Helix-turn-helix domain-containing protein n=1 Tax=Asanoa hainanensis TaxID=560556 RepID=A0A239P6C2_9ACTN|nr:helix-turn-helix domain-containing protein [Asanoa hainanensis]SNT62626.1 Helix-turn-helix domain-containing protein [Asanoa hainanensis]
MDTVELLVHPVRLRIVHALSGGRVVTTAQLVDRMPDVSKATVYRHVAVLADAGIIEVAGEHRVRGFVERSYRLHRERATIPPDRAAAATPAELRQAFAAAMATLIAEFDGYLDTADADPAADLVGFRQHAIWLSDAERADLVEAMRAALAPRVGNPPADGRRPHLLSPILFPISGD